MRVTQQMSSISSLYNITQSRAKLDKLQEFISSGYNVSRPSDDSVASRSLMEMGNTIKATNQYLNNISKVKNVLSVMSTALEGSQNMVTIAKQAVGNYIVENPPDTEKQATMITQLKNIKAQIIDISNTKINDVYVFGGTDNLEPPLHEKTGVLTVGSNIMDNIDLSGLRVDMEMFGNGIPFGTKITALNVGPPDSITLDNNATATSTPANPSTINFYGGDFLALNVEVGNNLTESMSVTPFDGASLTDSAAIFQSFDDLVAAVQANNPNSIRTAAKKLEDGAKQITNFQNTLAYRTIRLESLSTMHTQNIATLRNIRGTMQDVDYTKLAVQASNQKTAFEASLSSTAKISKMSLKDYL